MFVPLFIMSIRRSTVCARRTAGHELPGVGFIVHCESLTLTLPCARIGPRGDIHRVQYDIHRALRVPQAVTYPKKAPALRFTSRVVDSFVSLACVVGEGSVARAGRRNVVHVRPPRFLVSSYVPILFLCLGFWLLMRIFTIHRHRTYNIQNIYMHTYNINKVHTARKDVAEQYKDTVLNHIS